MRLAMRYLWLLLCASFVAVAAAPAYAGPYTRLQVLLPGESAAPGTPSGKSGTAAAQTAGVPFTITVRACDDTWTTVVTNTNTMQILSSDASATLPAPAQLVAGVGTFTVTFNAGGNFTVYAHDQSDGTIPDGTSSLVRSLVLQGFTFERITQKNQYAGVPMATSVSAVDPAGNVVTGYSGQVRLREITSYGEGRISPETVTLVAGTWSGSVTLYRADETSINRGNVNLYADLPIAPAKNGTSDPFTVHPGALARVQIIVPGEQPLPGSVAGRSGTPASQAAGHAFPVTVYATDQWWNMVPVADMVRIVSSDAAASTPVSGALTAGTRQFTITLNTVGTQTLTVSDQTNTGVQAMTSSGIAVIPSSVNGFAIATIASPVTAGSPVAVTIRAVDGANNTVPNFSGDATLTANTGAGSISPELITFANGTWSGNMVFRGAGGAVSFTCADFTSPPHTGTSNSFVVQPGPMAGLQVLLPGQTPQGGTADGKSGTPVGQSAGASFTVTVRAVDAYWNLVPGVADRVALGSSDAFASLPAETTLANGQILIPAKLYRTGSQTIWASDVDQPSMKPDTSSAVTVTGGPFARLVILAPGETVAPGMPDGRSGTATDQSINYAFTVTVLATDSWYNPVTGVNHTVHVTSNDPLAVTPGDTAMVDGRIDVPIRLSTGGYQQITASDVSDPTKTSSTTQVRAISSGFHLEAAVTPTTAAAGQTFTLTVKVTNDAGSVIQEINSFVTVDVLNASTRAPGRGTLLSRQFQLLQGQRAVSETYTFAEPVIFVVRDDAGNAPATSNVLTVIPGAPSAIHLTSAPPWVGGNKHATLSARLVDDFGNGVQGRVMTFALLSGAGTVTPVDSLTDTTGVARADFLSPRDPETDRIRASSGALYADLDLQTAFVNPGAPGGTITNYPNPFHPPAERTVIAWKLDDNATVTLRIFTLSGDLVLRKSFASGQSGGHAGLNEYDWDGLNGEGRVVASGGYIALVEAAGVGETLHTMRRKIAVVR